jgi:hypothetical protein
MSSHYSFSIRGALMGLPSDMHAVVTQKLAHFAEVLLRERNLEFRDDSRLVWAFVTGSLPPTWTMEKVMDELTLLQYIYRETLYTSKYSSSIPVIKTTLEKSTFHKNSDPSGKAFQYVQRYVIPVCRIAAVMESLDQGNMESGQCSMNCSGCMEDPDDEEEDEEENENEEPEEKDKKYTDDEIAELVILATEGMPEEVVQDIINDWKHGDGSLLHEFLHEAMRE